MSIPTPKYQIGQSVFYGDTHQSNEALPCPDCLDTKKWAVTLPSGATFDTSCQRCAGGYRTMDLPSLTRRIWKPYAKPLTIGSVRIDTHVGHGDDEPVSYMCRETGVGSGSVYRESQLFETEADAIAAATIRANKQTAEWAAKPEQLRRNEIGGMDFTAAFGEQARSTLWKAVYHFGQLKKKLEGLIQENEVSEDSVRDALDTYSLDWHLDPAQNPITALLAAARRAEQTPELIAALQPFAFLPDKAKEPVSL